MSTTSSGRSLEVHLTEADLRAALVEDVSAGLTERPRTVPPKYFYDARGSELFEEITELPEYYPTRTERAILEAHAGDIAEASGADTLVELGSGSSVKTRLLLDGLAGTGRLERYVPVDVSPSALEGAMDALTVDYPDLALHGVVADFERHVDDLPDTGRRMVAFHGSTIGNLEPGPRSTFLTDLRRTLHDGDTFLLGTDLVKDVSRLVAAYDDRAGVTAEFNRNVLHVLNRSLGADFDVDAFDHVAAWDAENEWIEMRLRASREMRATLRELDLVVPLERGEEIRTEVSAKFRHERVEAELAEAGFRLAHWWTGPPGDFALSLSRPP